MPVVSEDVPVNRSQAALVVRFLVELTALIGLGVGGYLLAAGFAGIVLAVVFPVGAAAVWGVVRVPGDPGEAIYPVSGVVRLALELGLLGATVALLVAVDRSVYGLVLAALAVAQYALGFDRVTWLLGTESETGRDPRA